MKHSTILMVEDDYLDIESVERGLRKMNISYTLHVAHNGVDAINMLTANDPAITPDVILLDINMPKMNGIEFLKIIKNYYRLSTIKIFVLTTSSDEYDKHATQELGITGYILKPLNFKTSTSDAMKLIEELL